MARPGGALDLFRAHVHGRGARPVVIGALGAAEVTRKPNMRTDRALAAIVARALATIAALAGTSLTFAGGSASSPTRVDGGAESSTAIAHWQIQSSSKAQQSGAEVSSAGYSTHEWYPVSG